MNNFDYATDTDWDRADARQRGQENPDAAWVCTDRDVIHANPYYQGPAMPHPDDGIWELEGEELEAALVEYRAAKAANKFTIGTRQLTEEDDLPF